MIYIWIRPFGDLLRQLFSELWTFISPVKSNADARKQIDGIDLDSNMYYFGEKQVPRAEIFEIFRTKRDTRKGIRALARSIIVTIRTSFDETRYHSSIRVESLGD